MKFFFFPSDNEINIYIYIYFKIEQFFCLVD